MTDETDAFARLKRLHVQGVLSDAEYEQEKTSLMGKSAGATRSASPVVGEGHVNRFGQTRWWLLGSLVVALLIGAYFFIKAAAIAEVRGELGGDSGGAAEQAAGLDSGLGELCLLAQFMNIESLGQRVLALGDAATAAGRTISWEETGNGAIARITWSDQLARQDHDVGIEMVRTANASALADCTDATEGAVVTRINVDGEILTGLAVGVALQQMLPPKPAAASSSSAGVSDEPQDRPSELASFTPEQQRLIDLNADLESECRGNPPGEENDACVKREAAMDRLNAAGVCWGTEDQAYAEFDFHICRPGSNGYASSPQARRNTVEAM